MEITDVAHEMRALYDDFYSQQHRGGWRALGQYVGLSGPYVRQIALGIRKPTVHVITKWMVVTTRQLPHIDAQVCPTCFERGVLVVHSTPDCGAPPAHTPRKRPERASVNLRRRTLDTLREAKHSSETWDDFLLNILGIAME